MTENGDDKSSHRRRLSAALRDHLIARRAFADQVIADQVISLAHLWGVRSSIARARASARSPTSWCAGAAPVSPIRPVTGVLVPLGRGFGVIDEQAVILSQTGVRL